MSREEELRQTLLQLSSEERIGLLLYSFIECDGRLFSPFTGMSSAMMVLAKRMAPAQQQLLAGLLYRQADRLTVASLTGDFAQEQAMVTRGKIDFDFLRVGGP